MNQMTLRKIPSRVSDALRKLSRSRSKSMNSTALETLEKGLVITVNTRKKRDLSKFAGTWSKKEADAFDKNTAMFGQIDRELWD